MTSLPRRLAFRIWAGCLESQAETLRRRTPQRSAERRGPTAAITDKTPARRDQAVEMQAHEAQIRRWIADEKLCRGAEIPLEDVALIAAIIYGHLYALNELRTRYPSVASLHHGDVSGIVQAIL